MVLHQQFSTRSDGSSNNCALRQRTILKIIGIIKDRLINVTLWAVRRGVGRCKAKEKKEKKKKNKKKIAEALWEMHPDEDPGSRQTQLGNLE